MPQPDFTIITATYNAAATLGRTLQSVEQQTHLSYEHIIVDGNSTDTTIPIVQAYIARQPNTSITLISEPDRGLYDALNKGIAHASGTYLIFLNAGDAFHSPTTLASAASTIPRNSASAPPAVIYGETDIVDNNGQLLRHRRLQVPPKLTWKSFRQGMLVCHQSFYAHRAIAPTYDLQYRYSADFDWCIRLLRAATELGWNTIQINEVLTDYLSEGLTTQNHRASLRERFQIMTHHYGRLTTILLHIYFAIRAVLKR